MLVVVLDVLVDDASEMTFAEDEDAIQAFAAYGPDPASANAFTTGARGGRFDDGDLFGDEDRVERGLELGVAIADQEPARADEAVDDVAACWVVQAPVGCLVIPAMWTRLVSSSMKNST